MVNLPGRPVGAIDKRHLIPRIRQWEEYRDEIVVDAYSLDTDDPNIKELKVVTIGNRA